MGVVGGWVGPVKIFSSVVMLDGMAGEPHTRPGREMINIAHNAAFIQVVVFVVVVVHVRELIQGFP